MTRSSVGTWFVGGTLSVAVACGGTVIDGGPGRDAVASAGQSASNGFDGISVAGSGAAGSGGSAPGDVDGSDAGMAGVVPPNGGAASDLAGTWSGYVENFTFSDDDDSIELTLDGNLSGRIRFGSARAPAPANDPEAIYPPGVVPATSGKAPIPDGPLAGPTFTLLNVVVSGKRVRFDIARNEEFESWCKLQDSYPYPPYPEGYACMPDWGYFGGNDGCAQQNPKTMEKVPRVCFQLALCTLKHVCECSESGCSAALTASAHFDVTFSGSEASGSVAGFDDYMPKTTHNLHLEKLTDDPSH